MPNYFSPADVPWYNDRKQIKKVVIKDGVTSIGYWAFYECEYLTFLTIPNSVTSIGKNAFESCKSLTSITIPNSVTSIGENAFENCSSLTSVTIPNSVTSIGNFAFSGCSSLTSITIPNSVTSIGERAFESCRSLTSLTIPNSVTSIGNYAFRYCSGLASITVEKGNTKYDSRDNCNAIIETNTNKLIAGCKNTTIPNSVTSIGDEAFKSCSGLTSITIPNSVTSIGNYAFISCSGLTSITISSSVTSIGNFAFSYCSGLTSITFERTTPPEFGEDVFYKDDKSISVYVPANSIEAYKSALGGLGLSDIKALPLIYLKDGEAYTQDSQIDGMDIYYTRSFANTNWQALYLPFSLNYEDWKDDFEVAYINTVRQYDDNGDGRADRTIMEAVKKNCGSTAPNTPYLIRAKTAGEKTFFVENATLYPAENNSVDCSTTTARFIFTGIYKEKSFGLSASNYYAINQGRLTTLSAWLPVPPYRWYMIAGTRSSVYNTSGWGWAKEISISVVGEEETTGVADIQHLSPDTQIFDVNGRKVSEKDLKPGIYVKNGKKFVVK